MKKKFISVAMLCTLAISAPLFVGCSDYDDDISNLQSQIDGLKTSVPTNEALSALQEALNSAKQDLETVKAGKADAQAVKELEEKVKELSELIGSSDDGSEIGNLSQQIQDLIEQVNGIDGDLQTKYNEWVKEKDALKSQIDDLNKQIASAATDEEVKTLKENLEAHVKEWNEISTKVEEAAKWVENNGAAIAELTNEVNNIQGIIDAIYGTEGSTVDSKKILAAITALPSYTEQLTALQKQINEGDDSMIQQLTSLNEWKKTVTDALIENGFKTQEGAADINSALKILADINKQLNTADENDLTFVDHLNNALKELESLSLLATQVQSIVFVPSSINNPYSITAERLYIKKNDNSGYNLVGVKTENKITFRVSPASALENFEEQYKLTFDGQVITKGNVDGLEVSKPTINKEEGTVTYTIEAVPTETYAVCAVLKAINEDAEGNSIANNGTEITSNYFVMGNIETKVESLYADYEANATPANGFAYSGENTSIDYTKGRVLKGTVSGKSDVIITDYLNEETPEYIYNLTGDTEYIKIENGVLSLKDQYKDQNSMIGKNVDITLQVKIGGYTYNTTTSYNKVSVERRIVDKTIVSEENALKNSWNSNIQYIALTADQMNAIINETELSRGDFNNLIVDASLSTPQTNDVYLVTANERYSGSVPQGVDKNQLYAVVKAGANVSSKVETKITLKESGSGESTTQTQSYTFRVWVDASDYSMFKPLDVNEVRWGSDNKVKFTPILDNYDHPKTITTTMNIKDLFDDYDSQKAEITKLDGQLIITSSTVTGATFDANNMTLAFNKSSYNGSEIKLEVIVKAGAKELEKKEVSIVVKQVSGKWTTPSKTITANDVNATYNGADGFSWVDFRGKTMWANGSTVATGADKDFNADPFTLYGLDKPTFSIEGDTYGYFDVDPATGKVSFTQEGKQSGFGNEYRVKLVVKANSPWGEIEGLTDDRAEIEIVVPAGTNK